MELAAPEHFGPLLRQLFTNDWVVYAKPPFGGAEHVLHYLARYTHRVAISNQRLVSFKDDQVSFRSKDYAAGSKERVMTVSADEFLRRFLIHVLPKGLVRIRHFRLFASRKRSASLLRCRLLLTPPLHLNSPRPRLRSGAHSALSPCLSSNGSQAFRRRIYQPSHSPSPAWIAPDPT